MAEVFAVRNLRLCTKDCLCLYVCPTGATDTENGQVDFDKCIGCGKCAASCPSGALTMAPRTFPPAQKKTEAVVRALGALAESKANQRAVAATLAKEAETPGGRRLAEALAQSARWQAEDLIRETGYLLPQGEKTEQWLAERLKCEQEPDFPREEAARLSELIRNHNRKN